MSMLGREVVMANTEMQRNKTVWEVFVSPGYIHEPQGYSCRKLNLLLILKWQLDKT